VDEQGILLRPEQYPVMRVLQSGKELTELVLGIQSPSLENTRWVQVLCFPEMTNMGN